MTPMLINGADPSRILAALRRGVEAEQIISVPVRCEARAADRTNPWLIVQQILWNPAVYEAFGISSLPTRFHFDSARGLEVIGSLANLLSRETMTSFVEDIDEAISEARRFLDAFYLKSYFGAVAFTCREPWCEWFESSILNETVIIGNGRDWWVLAVQWEE